MHAKPVIKLWDAPGLGLIISHPTGIVFSNQTGGTACLQPAMEGFYLPLYNDLAPLNPEEALTGYFTSGNAGRGVTHGINTEDAKHIVYILETCGFAFIEIDSEKLADSHEAWIYVRIYTQKYPDILTNFGETVSGVLTWNNSD